MFAAAVFLLSSCDSSGNHFVLKGKFRNMNIAELYLFNPATGQKDTISVQRGNFTFERNIEDTVVLSLMFPNYSIIPIFATPGSKVKVNGDASNLSDTEVEGTKENDEMTAFRLKANQLTPPERKEQAAQFISERPASIVSYYLLQRYYIQTIEPDYVEGYRLCSIITEANPQYVPARKMKKQLSILQAGQIGSKIPLFAVKDTKGKTITNKYLNAPVNAIVLWASWKYESSNMLRFLRKLQKKHPGKLAVLAISIDGRKAESIQWVKRDSIDFPIICDESMWQTPLAHRLGMTDIPSVTLANRRGKILKQNLTHTSEVNDEIEKLLNEKK
jgi:peroxiredoxin